MAGPEKRQRGPGGRCTGRHGSGGQPRPGRLWHISRPHPASPTDRGGREQYHAGHAGRTGRSSLTSGWDPACCPSDLRPPCSSGWGELCSRPMRSHRPSGRSQGQRPALFLEISPTLRHATCPSTSRLRKWVDRPAAGHVDGHWAWPVHCDSALTSRDQAQGCRLH